MAPAAPIAVSTIEIPSLVPMKLDDLRASSCRSFPLPLISTRGSKPSPKPSPKPNPKPSLLRSLRLSGASRQLRERLLLFQPRLIFFFLVDDDLAAHVGVRHTAEFGAEDLEGPGSGGDQPDIADHARHQ